VTRPPTLSGWGRLAVPGRELRSEDLPALAATASLTRGLGRSYGDSSLPAPGHDRVAASPLADRILAFDPESGLLRAEAGLSLAEMNRLLLPRGWFTPVTPGTQLVTLGGIVAADVHGKNHHVAGTFGRHVRSLVVRLAPRGDHPGSIVRCSRDELLDLFRATLGGMGLTGHVLEVEVQLEHVPSPWIWAESDRYPALEPLLSALRAASREWPMTVAWVDALASGRKRGRGIVHRGRWAEPREAPARPPAPARRVAVPFEAPSWLLNRPAVALANALLWRRHPARGRRGVATPESFFYPLDAVHYWNRLYGRRGFTQYQCVLPDPGAEEATLRFFDVLERATTRGPAPFLCVIKDCGGEGEGLLSFPRPGLSVALDLPADPGIQDVVDALNETVIAAGGRIYLAKDAFTRPEHFRSLELRLPEFERIRRRYDPEGYLASAQSVRLGLTPPGGPHFSEDP
jgi:FAD/FMN-containing dehydrogenase